MSSKNNKKRPTSVSAPKPTNNGTSGDNTDAKLAQYTVIASEYNTLFSSAQNVVVINLAISIGVLAAMATLLTDKFQNSPALMAAFSMFSFIGLLGANSCIQTLHVVRVELMNLQTKLKDLESELSIDCFHKSSYYKPIHITLTSFQFAIALFSMLFSIGILMLLKYASVNFFVNSPIHFLVNVLSVIVCTIFFSAALGPINKLIFKCHRKAERKLLNRSRRKDRIHTKKPK